MHAQIQFCVELAEQYAKKVQLWNYEPGTWGDVQGFRSADLLKRVVQMDSVFWLAVRHGAWGEVFPKTAKIVAALPAQAKCEMDACISKGAACGAENFNTNYASIYTAPWVIAAMFNPDTMAPVASAIFTVTEQFGRAGQRVRIEGEEEFLKICKQIGKDMLIHYLAQWSWYALPAIATEAGSMLTAASWRRDTKDCSWPDQVAETMPSVALFCCATLRLLQTSDLCEELIFSAVRELLKKNQSPETLEQAIQLLEGASHKMKLERRKLRTLNLLRGRARRGASASSHPCPELLLRARRSASAI